jgi:glycerol-3-phosphate O-acyltransferase
LAAITVTIATVVVATDAMVPDGSACVIAAQAIAAAIADATGMTGTTLATATTMATAVTTAIATTVTTTILRVGGTHDGQVSGQ